MEFPELPPLPENIPAWSANVQNAHYELQSSYTRAKRLLGQDDVDPLRYHIQADVIVRDLVPILEAMELNAANEGLPIEWVHAATTCIINLLDDLNESHANARGREHLNIAQVHPVTVTHTGRRGRPRKVIDRDYLAAATSADTNIAQPKIARAVGVHYNTVRRYRRMYGLSSAYSRITTVALDLLMKAFKRNQPDSGIRYAVAYLRNKGLHIQRWRVIESLRRIDGIGNALRQRRHIRRRKYMSKRPNYLWHCDGHHKLIRWGIVIHGFIDGYCRTITGLHASNNNRASTVLDLFIEAISKHGVPSRVRGDRGGENMQTAVMMVLLRGRNRASFIWGSSTRNTRIERLWVEVGSQFARRWRVFFMRLERLHHLNVDNPDHIWLLHTLFLPMINNDCGVFQHQWNAHPISGPDTNNQSPNALRLLGMTEGGIYNDDCDGWTPEEITEFYGVYGHERPRRPGQSGAGHPPDESTDEDGDWVDEENGSTGVAIAAGVEVIEAGSPFQNEELEQAFFAALAVETERSNVPYGYGVHVTEREDDEYPTIEMLQVGSRRNGELSVSLPLDVWLPRAELWARALNLMIIATEMQG